MAGESKRIIIFNLDSFTSSAAIKKIIEGFHSDIVLICASKRYGGKYGSFLKQFEKNLKRSGMTFVIYLSLNLIWYRIAIILSDFLNIFLRNKKIYSLKQLSKKYKIPIVYTNEINDKDIVSLIKEKKPDLIISAFFDHIIGKEIIGIPSLGVINVHTALLPKCRGPFPVLCTVLNNEKAGVTVHYVDEKLDTGDIIVQKEIILDDKKSILTLDRELMNIGADIVIDIVNNVGERNIQRSSQNIEGYYVSYPTIEDIKKLKNKNKKLFSYKEFINSYI